QVPGERRDWFCPAGMMLTGMRIRSGEEVDAVFGRCRPFMVVIDRGSIPYKFPLIWTPLAPVVQGPRMGGTGGTAQNYDCPPKEFVIAMEGRSGARVNQLRLRCGRLRLTGNENGWSLAVEDGGAAPICGRYGGY